MDQSFCCWQKKHGILQTESHTSWPGCRHVPIFPYQPYYDPWPLPDVVSPPKSLQWGFWPCLWVAHSFPLNRLVGFWNTVNVQCRIVHLFIYLSFLREHSAVQYLSSGAWPFSCWERRLSSCSKWPSCCNTSTTPLFAIINSALRSVSLVLRDTVGLIRHLTAPQKSTHFNITLMCAYFF